ncbi:sulfite exporter TauE/SafE family protein [Pseudooceanicola marinus]|uniref:sulfite exporter TauE/SafE family protein n=1 Tax=Pseudooceanicola marinus TaxID=396013 RepID=UPI001E5C645F|nr:sulfite exporter TauE/SafE family protein [Pseudooceanicola marinus]
MTSGYELQRTNIIKNALATLTTTIAVLIFSFGGAVSWGPAALIFIGAAIGCALGGRLARRMNPQCLRIGVICLGLVLTQHYL